MPQPCAQHARHLSRDLRQHRLQQAKWFSPRPRSEQGSRWDSLAEAAD